MTVITWAIYVRSLLVCDLVDDVAILIDVEVRALGRFVFLELPSHETGATVSTHRLEDRFVPFDLRALLGKSFHRIRVTDLDRFEVAFFES